MTLGYPAHFKAESPSGCSTEAIFVLSHINSARRRRQTVQLRATCQPLTLERDKQSDKPSSESILRNGFPLLVDKDKALTRRCFDSGPISRRLVGPLQNMKTKKSEAKQPLPKITNIHKRPTATGMQTFCKLNGKLMTYAEARKAI